MSVMSRRLERAEAALAEQYGTLTAEERFRLISAAGVRGDEAGQARLVAAGGRITLSMPDHIPIAHAFDELAMMVFMELLATAADYLEAFEWANDASPSVGAVDSCQGEDCDTTEVEAEGDAEEVAAWDRSLSLALGLGYMLKAKSDAWKLFSERMGLPPFAIWQHLPGFDRLQRALTLAEASRVRAGGHGALAEPTRPEGEAEVPDMPFTAEEAAASLDRFFRERVVFWGGE